MRLRSINVVYGHSEDKMKNPSLNESYLDVDKLLSIVLSLICLKRIIYSVRHTSDLDNRKSFLRQF